MNDFGTNDQGCRSRLSGSLPAVAIGAVGCGGGDGRPDVLPLQGGT